MQLMLVSFVTCCWWPGTTGSLQPMRFSLVQSPVTNWSNGGPCLRVRCRSVLRGLPFWVARDGWDGTVLFANKLDFCWL